MGIKVTHYRAFGDKPQGFDRIFPVNVIIGRNNSGKSSLIDLVEWVAQTPTFKTDVELPSSPGRKRRPSVHFTQTYASLMGDAVPGQSAEEWMSEQWPDIAASRWREKLGTSVWPDYKEFWEPLVVSWIFGNSHSASVISHVTLETKGTRDLDSPAQRFIKDATRHNLALRQAVPLAGKAFHRISAERSITPEPLDTSSLELSPNGVGVTNLINRFVNDADLPRQVVEVQLLDGLNEVFEPDARFTSIEVQRLRDNRYELFLVEDEKGPVPLSSSGSGLQTVILVLAALEVLPRVPKASPELVDWVFAFEELENNLHPALQRRLFWLIRERAVEAGATIFLTTHSPVVVDLFADDPAAQLVHVTHDGAEAQVNAVLSHNDRRGIFDDLDVRASDLLQANGIVWVEGPTDRMYFNHWIELWTEGDLREGKDYQCVFYGGALAAHLTGNEPEGRADAIEILRVNINAIMLLDSDRKGPTGDFKKRVRRLRDEIEATGGMAWITKGREVEHYIPHATFESWKEPGIAKLDPYGDMLAYLNKLESSRKKSYDKVAFARDIIPHLTKEHLATHSDLSEKLDAVCALIRQWSRKPAPPPAISPDLATPN